MTTIIIPKDLAKNKTLVAVPHEAYEQFIAWQKKIKSTRTFEPTAAEKKSLQRARKNFARGAYVTLDKLQHELGIGN